MTARQRTDPARGSCRHPGWSLDGQGPIRPRIVAAGDIDHDDLELTTPGSGSGYGNVSSGGPASFTTANNAGFEAVRHRQPGHDDWTGLAWRKAERRIRLAHHNRNQNRYVTVLSHP